MIVAFPFLWELRSSLLPGQQATQIPPTWIPSKLTFSHFRDLIETQPFLRYILNSVLVAVCVAIGQIVTSATAGYAFARLKFPGRDKLFLVYLATMMIPPQVSIIPVYLIVAQLRWVDTYQALIVPFLASAFSVFLMRQFMLAIPIEFEEAARVDGAGYLRTLLVIILPLCKSALATVGLLAFMTNWGSLLWPLIVTSSTNHRTVPLGLATLQAQQGFTDFAQMMAGSVLAMAPMFIMFLFLQRFVVAAASMSGLKG